MPPETLIPAARPVPAPERAERFFPDQVDDDVQVIEEGIATTMTPLAEALPGDEKLNQDLATLFLIDPHEPGG